MHCCELASVSSHCEHSVNFILHVLVDPWIHTNSRFDKVPTQAAIQQQPFALNRWVHGFKTQPHKFAHNLLLLGDADCACADCV